MSNRIRYGARWSGPAGSPTGFCRGTHDKFGNLFGVELTRRERLAIQAHKDRMDDPAYRERINFKNSVSNRARMVPVTKVKLKCLED